MVGFPDELRQGIRQMLRVPAFAATVVVLLALGIGINAATYSVVRNVLLEPLPFRSAEQLLTPAATWISPATRPTMTSAAHRFLYVVMIAPSW
jgi:hypothetical protein